MWTIEPGHSGTNFCITSQERDENGPYTEVIAAVHAADNALLIAAAPDLLEALKEAYRLLRIHVAPSDLGGERLDLTDCVAVREIVSALAKARGDA